MTTPDVENQKAKLRELILIGKERGYLLASEIQDHLPDIVDAELIETITVTFNEMGIPVRERLSD